MVSQNISNQSIIRAEQSNLIIFFSSQIYCNQIFCDCNFKIIPLQDYVSRPKKRIVELPILSVDIHISTFVHCEYFYLSTFVRLSAEYTPNTFYCLSFWKKSACKIIKRLPISWQHVILDIDDLDFDSEYNCSWNSLCWILWATITTFI